MGMNLNKILTTLTLGAALAACGGEPYAGGGDDVDSSGDAITAVTFSAMQCNDVFAFMNANEPTLPLLSANFTMVNAANVGFAEVGITAGPNQLDAGSDGYGRTPKGSADVVLSFRKRFQNIGGRNMQVNSQLSLGMYDVRTAQTQFEAVVVPTACVVNDFSATIRGVSANGTEMTVVLFRRGIGG